MRVDQALGVAQPLASDEIQQVGVDGLGLGRGHAVREALVGFERAVLPVPVLLGPELAQGRHLVVARVPQAPEIMPFGGEAEDQEEPADETAHNHAKAPPRFAPESGRRHLR